MKKIFMLFCLLILCITNAYAVNMVQKEDVLSRKISVAGLPDFPPFSFYTVDRGNEYILNGAFLNPFRTFFKNYSFDLKQYRINSEQFEKIPMLLLAVRSGEVNVFIGAMSDTKLFTGLEIVYPAALSNPIHVITTPDGQEKIKSTDDLQNLRGIVCTQEYFSDFVLRKIKALNVTYVDTPYEAYEKIFTDEADYIIGSAYFNRIMSSRYGINRYLVYSKNPIFKTPIFIALSKTTPVLREYVKVFNEEFSKPEFGEAVKQEVIRIISEEEEKNDGIVPPAFAKKVIEQEAQKEQETVDEEQKQQGGRIVENKSHEKTIDEVLEGI